MQWGYTIHAQTTKSTYISHMQPLFLSMTATATATAIMPSASAAAARAATLLPTCIALHNHEPDQLIG